jgi:hypothetical protein
MWIRWQSRIRKKSRLDDNLREVDSEVLYVAVMKTARENGKPQARVAVYLGAFDTDFPHYLPRCRWWEDARQKLDALALSDEERQQMEEQIAVRIPKPTADEEAEYREIIARRNELRNGRSI